MDVEDRVLNPKALTLSQNVISMENIRDLKHCHNHVLCRPHINTHNTFHRNLNNSIFYPRKLLKSKFMNDAIVTHFHSFFFSFFFFFFVCHSLALFLCSSERFVSVDTTAKNSKALPAIMYIHGESYEWNR